MIRWFVHPSAPWLLALAVLVLGALLLRFARPRRSRFLRVAGSVVGGLGLLLGSLMLIGAFVMHRYEAKVAAANPAPGKLIDVGGYRIHVWCEGPASAETVVWIPGGYGQALWMAHLQRAAKASRRSCLIDRGGIGWSDVAPLPRTMDRVVEEMHAALHGAGERGPFVLVGHSMGGPTAVNYAVAYPEDVKALALLDPTSPAWFIEMLTYCGTGPNPVSVLGAAYGLGLVKGLNPMLSDEPEPKAIREHLTDVWQPLLAMEIRPSALISSNSFFDGQCSKPYSIARAPGALGDLPILVIPQNFTPEELVEQRKREDLSSELERRNYNSLMDLAAIEYTTFSSRSRLIYAKHGATHQFPLLDPDWTLEQVNTFIAEVDAGTFPTPASSPSAP